MERGKMSIIKTISGRIILAPPPIRSESNMKAINDAKKVKKWLINEAIKEAEFKEDEWSLSLFKNIDIKRITRAESNIMNHYLFGREEYYK